MQSLYMQSLYLAGRCANGSELDCGTRFHAVPEHAEIALCGARPGRRSAGWRGDQLYDRHGRINCPRCIKRMNGQK